MKRNLASIILLVLCIHYYVFASPISSNKAPELKQIMASLSINNQEQIISTTSCDLNRNKTTQTIVITCRRRDGGHPMGGDVVVLETRRGVLTLVWRHKSLNPWKLEVADVDGDGKREIVVGVWKKSPKDPQMAKRVFVYLWNGQRLIPKWLGSRLGRRFDDFTVYDINSDGCDELLALEKAPKGKNRISAYRWLSFGFEWIGCSRDIGGIEALSNDPQPIALTSSSKQKIRYVNGSIEVVE